MERHGKIWQPPFTALALCHSNTAMCGNRAVLGLGHGRPLTCSSSFFSPSKASSAASLSRAFRSCISKKAPSRGRVNANLCAYYVSKTSCVLKLVEEIGTASAKIGTGSRHVSNYKWAEWSRKAREYCERKARIVCEQHFISPNRLVSPSWFTIQ